MKYVYKDFTGLYYAGSGIGWAGHGGSTWTKDITKAKHLTLVEAERMKSYITGEAIEVR